MRITDLSHRRTIHFEFQYVHLYSIHAHASIYRAHVHVHLSIRTYVRTLAARTVKGLGYTPYVSLYQGQKHFCPRQRVYKARNMNWRFTLIVRQEVRVCRINSHSRETRVSNIPWRERGFSTLNPLPPDPPSKVYPKKARRELVHVSSLCATQHYTMKVFLRMTNRRRLVWVKFAFASIQFFFSRTLGEFFPRYSFFSFFLLLQKIKILRILSSNYTRFNRR